MTELETPDPRVIDAVERHLGPVYPRALAEAQDGAIDYRPLNIEDRIAVISGASDGIGRATAELFAIHGADLIIHGRNEKRLGEVAELVHGLGSKRVEIVAGDISSPETAAKIAALVEERFDGKLDILVNNAGSAKDKRMDKLDENDWDQVVNAHLKGAFLLARANWAYLTSSDRARIINISSISGVHGNDGQANYSAAMGGLISMTRTWAIELADYRGTANALAFGPVDTKIWSPLARGARMQENAARKARGEEPVGEDFDALAPLKERMVGKRFITPEEAASKVLFLASRMGDGITGQVIEVEAGLTAMKHAVQAS